MFFEEALKTILKENLSIKMVFVGKDTPLYYGNKTCMEKVKEELKEYKDRICHFDSMPHSELYPILMNSRVVVIPSLVDNIPNTCLEAMAHGCTIVASDGASLDELIEDNKSGYLFKLGDSKALAEKTLYAWDLSEQERQRIADNAKQSIEKLAPDMVLKELEDYYVSVIEEWEKRRNVKMKYSKVNGKLAFYNKKADSKYWDHHWAEIELSDLLLSYKSGKLDYHEKMFLKHLPKDQKILEAGCGIGRYVVALKARNYDAVGIDYADETIIKVQELGYSYITWGDVFSLEFDDESLGAYISLGVIEHHLNYEDIIIEAGRVLKKGGKILLSVPYFNLLRKIIFGFPWNISRTNKNYQFYQYAFTKEELEKLLEKNGFRCCDYNCSGPFYTFEYHIPFFLKKRGKKVLYLRI